MNKMGNSLIVEKKGRSKTNSNDILISILNNISTGIIAFDLNGNIIIANELAKSNLHIEHSLDEIMKMNVIECVRNINVLKEIIQNCLKRGKKSFKIDSIEFNGNYLRIGGKSILNGMLVTVEDITEKKESERSVFRALIKGQEEERKRIAKEIHDGLGPILSAIKMHVEAVQSDFDAIEKSTLAKLETTYNLIDNVTSDMRSLSHDLMPRIVEDFGLVEALDGLSKTLSNNKCEVMFTHNFNGERFNKSIELNLYRISQELIHNSLKHSGAQKINVQLIKHSNSLVLMVEDNGNGFSQKNTKDYGIGLKNIEARIKSMGGVFFIDSAPGIGVTSTIEIAMVTS